MKPCFGWCWGWLMIGFSRTIVSFWCVFLIFVSFLVSTQRGTCQRWWAKDAPALQQVGCSEFVRATINSWSWPLLTHFTVNRRLFSTGRCKVVFYLFMLKIYLCANYWFEWATQFPYAATHIARSDLSMELSEDRPKSRGLPSCVLIK